MKASKDKALAMGHAVHQKQKVAVTVAYAAESLKYPPTEFFDITPETWQAVQACALGEPSDVTLELLMALATMLGFKYECLFTTTPGKREWMKDQ